MSDQIKWQGLATAYAGTDDNFHVVTTAPEST